MSHPHLPPHFWSSLNIFGGPWLRPASTHLCPHLAITFFWVSPCPFFLQGHQSLNLGPALNADGSIIADFICKDLNKIIVWVSGKPCFIRGSWFKPLQSTCLKYKHFWKSKLCIQLSVRCPGETQRGHLSLCINQYSLMVFISSGRWMTCVLISDALRFLASFPWLLYFHCLPPFPETPLPPQIGGAVLDLKEGVTYPRWGKVAASFLVPEQHQEALGSLSGECWVVGMWQGSQAGGAY